MESIMIVRAGIKKHKWSLLGIATLLCLVSLALSTVLTVSISGRNYIREEIKRAGFGDVTAWVSNMQDIEMELDGMQTQRLIFSEYEANGVESDSEGQLIPWAKGEERYRFFQDDRLGYQTSSKEISPGTVYVSPSMVSMMELKIGDVITFPIARGGETISLTVSGYYEDPFMGSSMIGMKGFLISEADYGTILWMIEEAGMDSLARSGAMIHMSQEDRTSISPDADFLHSAKAIEGFMLILQDAFSGLLAAFTLVLLGVTMIVLGHSIASTMEQEYKNLGILKTVGLTGRRLIWQQLVQYMLAMCIGIWLGICLSKPVVRVIGRLTVTTTGVLLPDKLPLLPCVVTFTGMVLLLAVFTHFKLRKIVLVTPMKVIRGEMIKTRRSVRKGFRLKANGISLQLAIRQLVSGKRRYIGACLVAVLLVFFASLTGRMDAWLGSDGKGMMDAFHPADLDLGVQALGELNQAELEETVRSYTEITDRYLLAMPSVSVNGSNYTANVISEPERFHMSQGKTSIKDDEIVLTEIVAADLEAGIGDKVTVSGDTGSKEFTVSGIYHCANDMGANVGMNQEGYLSIGQDDEQLWCQHYFLSDASQKDAISKGLESTYGGDVHVHENSWPGLLGIIRAMHALLIVMYGMIAIFVCIVTVMTGSKMFTAEQQDIGIYKSMGYSLRMLRMTFALRFGMVAILGALIGTILAHVLTDSLVSAVMRLAGISNFASSPSIVQILMPGMVVVLFFLGCAYLVSGRMKRVDMTVLTAE